jgi:hypothetical protein
MKISLFSDNLFKKFISFLRKTSTRSTHVSTPPVFYLRKTMTTHLAKRKTQKRIETNVRETKKRRKCCAISHESDLIKHFRNVLKLAIISSLISRWLSAKLTQKSFFSSMKIVYELSGEILSGKAIKLSALHTAVAFRDGILRNFFAMEFN